MVDAVAPRKIVESAPISSALRDAAITFAVALVLFLPIVGLRTDIASGGLTVVPEFGKAIVYSAGVAFIRFLLDVFIWRRRDKRIAAGVPSISGTAYRALGGAAFVFGGLAYFFPDLRNTVVTAAGDVYWLLGTLADLLAFTCMAAFVILLAMAVTRVCRIALTKNLQQPKASSATLPGRFTNISGEFPVALLLIAVILPIIVAGPQQRYAIDTATVILIYIMLGWGLNVVVGLAGLLDLGYVAFYAVGAYTYALLATTLGWSFWWCLPLAGLFAALWGIMLGFPVLRLRGDYLAIVTLAFGEIIRIVLLNWQSLTGGPNGITNVPRPDFFGLTFSRTGDSTFHEAFGLEFDAFHRILFLYYLILILALITNLVTLRLRRLPIGRAWEALREDEIACRSLGINTVTTKLSAFAIGAMFGGFAGAFFATRQGFISPESFSFQESAWVLAIVVLGGLGSQVGVVIAAIVLVGSAERFRELQDYRLLILGVAMVVIMVWRPRGLLSNRTPSASLHVSRTISAAHVKEGRG